MPEGPELFIAASFIRRVCEGKIFTKIIKSNVTKCSDIPWNDGDEFTISASSRGKELILRLTPTDTNLAKKYILFHFGMSGLFTFTDVDDPPKHSHLRFITSTADQSLNFVDTRRFGKWEMKNSDLEWNADRGPCALTEYDLFRENILKSLDNSIFNRPVCEAMLDQRYFNGIGNYLRAEIMFRAGVPPFEKARTILQSIIEKKEGQAKEEDLLSLCRTVQNEVVGLQSTNYTSSIGYITDNDKRFDQWLQCYGKATMNKLTDKNKRTVWFRGAAGPMAKRSQEQPRKKKTNRKKKSDVSEEIKVEIEETIEVPKNRKRKSPADKGPVKKESKTLIKMEEKTEQQSIKKEIKLDLSAYEYNGRVTRNRARMHF